MIGREDRVLFAFGWRVACIERSVDEAFSEGGENLLSCELSGAITIHLLEIAKLPACLLQAR